MNGQEKQRFLAPLTPMSSPRCGVGAAVLDGKVIAMGEYQYNFQIKLDYSPSPMCVSHYKRPRSLTVHHILTSDFMCMNVKYEVVVKGKGQCQTFGAKSSIGGSGSKKLLPCIVFLFKHSALL